MFRKPIQQTPQRQSLIEIETTGPHTAEVHCYDLHGRLTRDYHLTTGEGVLVQNQQGGESVLIHLGGWPAPTIPDGYYRVPRWVAWLCGVAE